MTLKFLLKVSSLTCSAVQPQQTKETTRKILPWAMTDADFSYIRERWA